MGFGLVAGEAGAILRPIAPPHASGLQRTVTALRVRLDSPEQAQAAFEGMLDRFHHPDRWFQSPRVPDAMRLHYRLADATGVRVTDRGPTVGDFGSIRLGHSTADDWVRIEAVGVDVPAGRAAMTFRPTRAPIGTPHADEVTHFYTDEATNTMSIRRDGDSIVSSVDVRNVRHNTGDRAPVGRRLRNHVIGLGTQAGGQKWMWDTWVSESTMAGLRGAGVSRAQLLRSPSRVEGAATFVPDYLRTAARALRGQPAVGAGDATWAARLLPDPW